MCTATITYDRRNKRVSQTMEQLSMMKGVNIIYNFKKKPKMNGLDEAIEDIKMGRFSTYENFEEFEMEIRKELGYV